MSAQVASTGMLLGRLHELGLRIGYKILDLLVYRERHKKREIKILSILTFVSTCVWRYLFGHSGELLKAQDNELECKHFVFFNAGAL